MKNNKNKFLFIISAFLLFVLSGALILSFLIPGSVLISEGAGDKSFLPENCRWLFTIDRQNDETVWSNDSLPIESQNEKCKVYFCGIIPVKTVELTKSSTDFVTLGGDAIGISLHIDGVLVVGTNNVAPHGISPAKSSGIRKGDIIEEVNSIKVKRTSEISDIIEKSDGEVTFLCRRNGKKISFQLKPLKDETGSKKVGLYIRDTVSGIGTLTFLTDSGFGAVGHPISDTDTGEFVHSGGGSVYKASIVGVEKGEKGSAGSLCGIFTSEKIAEITKNTDTGVYGTGGDRSMKKTVPVAPKEEIKCGKAEIYCDIGDGVQNFDAKVLRIIPSGEKTKGMVIEITDKKLISKTGGIVQGMSGSPIMQDGKLIGAVTHVFVNDPTKGYGIFIENMLSESEKIE